jgi:hypothetical protein
MRLISVVFVAIVLGAPAGAVDIAKDLSHRLRIAAARVLRDELAEESDRVLRRTIVRVELLPP